MRYISMPPVVPIFQRGVRYVARLLDHLSLVELCGRGEAFYFGDFPSGECLDL